jgi:alcohol dehydrogenase (cytochrome c)
MTNAAKLCVAVTALILMQTQGNATAAPAGIPPAMARSGPGAPTGLTSVEIYRPAPGTWPVYSGDYSGQHYSPLTQINRDTVKGLELAWTSDRLATGPGDGVILGGDPRGTTIAPSGGAVRGAPLIVDGVIYASSPNNVWAIDARTGKMKWRYYWKHRGGTTIGNRGVGIWGDYLFVETPDNYLISLDRHSGKERWHTEIEPFELQFFSTTAPIVVGDHVLVGTGSDHEHPGRLQSFDPVTGERQWSLWTVPLNAGDPGADTWKNIDAARHGGAQPWVPGSYDPETNLYIFGTSGPNPEYFPAPRNGPDGGDNALFTSSMIAVDVETGKMKWYYQSSPGETHDYDAAQTPVMADITFEGRLRKVSMSAHRNGYFYVIDRVTGEHLLTTKYDQNANWALGLNARGQPMRDPAKDSQPNGALVSPPNAGATNWLPPAYNPETKLFYVASSEDYSMYYKTEGDPRGSMGLGGKAELGVAGGGTYLKAIDPSTGRTAWQIKYPTVAPTGYPIGRGNGLLATAGGLIFNTTPDAGLVARDAANGKALWHVERVPTNAAQTFMVDGKQYLLFGSGFNLYAYALP